MSTSNRTNGFSIIEGVIVVVFVGIVVVLGLTFYNMSIKQDTASDSTSSTAESITATPIPEINTANDLDKVTSDLDALDFTDNEDATLLEQQDTAF